MSIFIENETTKNYDFDYESLINQVIDKCVEYINCPYETCVNVTIVSNDAIKEINNEYRQIDKVTDVLSFPMIDYEDAPGNFDGLEEDAEDYFDPDTGELILGDIVLCAEKIDSQAKEYGHSVKREMAFLTAHSMFHLFGYDHMTDEERTEMEAKQEEVLTLLGITRD
ncbi:MAG: rRNA maturation RNase YbeY [Lachnospiraceae bacterium]|nr:rRNA maturation RNase YbeY [Lachnospiraceae bacterium]